VTATLSGRVGFEGGVQRGHELHALVRRPAVLATPAFAAGTPIGGDAPESTRGIRMVEGKGFEPSTSALRTPRSPN
jgi:hypothetical protein